MQNPVPGNGIRMLSPSVKSLITPGDIIEFAKVYHRVRDVDTFGPTVILSDVHIHINTKLL